MSATATDLTGIKRQRPEWGSWLAAIEETLREADERGWDAAVPTGAHVATVTTPLLTGTTVTIDVRTVRNFLQRLIRVASRNATPEMATLRFVPGDDPYVLTLFKASLCQDTVWSAEAATLCGADAGALEAVVALVSVPFLQACNRRWATTITRSWREGYCALCGAWPAFAETRGIERNRFFRCGRCGGEWHARPLHCSYCGEDNHNALVSLVPENGELNAVIEGCTSCRGYVKTFTRLQGCAPGTVMLDDLASVHLDVAALEQGYRRPPGPGHQLNVAVTARNARSFFAWKS